MVMVSVRRTANVLIWSKECWELEKNGTTPFPLVAILPEIISRYNEDSSERRESLSFKCIVLINR